MAAKNLTAERVRELLNYDPETGVFTRRTRGRGIPLHGRAGSNAGAGYLHMRVEGCTYMLHRLAWLHYYGEWPKHNIDHIDRDRSNNAIQNLRDVRQTINKQNCVYAPNGSTGERNIWYGERRGRMRYRVSIKAQGRRPLQRWFDTLDEAIVARDAAIADFHPYAPKAHSVLS